MGYERLALSPKDWNSEKEVGKLENRKISAPRMNAGTIWMKYRLSIFHCNNNNLKKKNNNESPPPFVYAYIWAPFVHLLNESISKSNRAET